MPRNRRGRVDAADAAPRPTRPRSTPRTADAETDAAELMTPTRTGDSADAREQAARHEASVASKVPPSRRGHARDLFAQLAALPETRRAAAHPRRACRDSPALVEYLARRFRNRGEWLDDLTQVATIG